LLSLRFSEEGGPAAPLKRVKEVALLNMMYIGLCLDNPQITLQGWAQVQTIRECNQMHKFLAHNYAAEALCALGRVDEALTLLDPSASNFSEKCFVNSTTLDATLESPYMEHTERSERLPLFPKAMLYVNLATLYIYKDDTKQAIECLQQSLTLIPGFAPAVKALVYLSLRQGYAEQALALLRGTRESHRDGTNHATVGQLLQLGFGHLLTASYDRDGDEPTKDSNDTQNQTES
jgi:tetratricopeptide (TPR) repeat protein